MPGGGGDATDSTDILPIFNPTICNWAPYFCVCGQLNGAALTHESRSVQGTVINQFRMRIQNRIRNRISGLLLNTSA